MDRDRGGGAGAYPVRAGAGAHGARDWRRGERDPSNSFDSASSRSSTFHGSRSSANVNTSRIKGSRHAQVRHAEMTAAWKAAALHDVNDAQLAPREREILLQLLVQITDFVARKQQQQSKRATASTTPDWRKDFRRSRVDDIRADKRSNNSDDLFAVVVRVCEERMQQLHDGDDEVRSLTLSLTE